MRDFPLEYRCTFCGGDVVYDRDARSFVHADDGERIPPETPGDELSAAHNRAGTPVHRSNVREVN